MNIINSNRGYEWAPSNAHHSCIRITLNGSLFAGGIPNQIFNLDSIISDYLDSLGKPYVWYPSKQTFSVGSFDFKYEVSSEIVWYPIGSVLGTFKIPNNLLWNLVSTSDGLPAIKCMAVDGSLCNHYVPVHLICRMLNLSDLYGLQSLCGKIIQIKELPTLIRFPFGVKNHILDLPDRIETNGAINVL